jgi:hypothetical protein
MWRGRSESGGEPLADNLDPPRIAHIQQRAARHCRGATGPDPLDDVAHQADSPTARRRVFAAFPPAGLERFAQYLTEQQAKAPLSHRPAEDSRVWIIGPDRFDTPGNPPARLI